MDKEQDLLDAIHFYEQYPTGPLTVNGPMNRIDAHIRKLEQDCLQHMREHPIPYRSVLDSISKPKRIDITYH